MPAPDWKLVGQALNAKLAARRLSSQDLALRAGVDRKTIDRLRNGKAVRVQTLQWIEQALGENLAHNAAATDGIAAQRYGGYRRDAVLHMVGAYIALRRSFDRADRIIASALNIAWDNDQGALRFAESQDNRLADGKSYAYRFGGDVLIPPNLGVVHFVVRSDDGRVRTITTSMPREDNDTLIMRGFILTLNELRDIGYYPVTSPIALLKDGGPHSMTVGVIDSGHENFDWASGLLADIETSFLPHV